MKYAFGDADLTAYVDPAADDAAAVHTAFREQLDWDTSGEYDGWQRADAEAWLRQGYQDGDPVVVEKSGNAYAMLTRGSVLEQAGAHIAPTVMFAPDDAAEQGKGFDYTMFQQYIADGTDTPSWIDADEAISFRDRYNKIGDISDQAIKQFADNCAAIDALGFRPISGESVFRDFLTTCDECYMVDFGTDLGGAGKPIAGNGYDVHDRSAEEMAVIQRDDMADAARDFLDEEDRDLFDTAYEDARRAFLSDFATGDELDDLAAAQEMSSRERHYRRKQVQ